MTITNKIKGDTFSSLDYGTVFIYKDCVYMRIETIDYSKASDINAINLETGKWCCFPSNIEVKKVDAELVIR